MAGPGKPGPAPAGEEPWAPSDDDREYVKSSLEGGATQQRVSDALGISVETLVKYFPRECRMGRALYDVKFETNMLRQALSDDSKDNVLRIFLAKSRLGYRELVKEDPDEKTPERMSNAKLRERIAANARERAASGEARLVAVGGGNADAGGATRNGKKPRPG